MARNYYHNEGYTRGGLDVVTGVNLFFKSILLFPIFVLAAFVGLTMMKHVLFNGIPSMNGPTEEQREIIRERDQRVSTEIPQESNPERISPYPMPPSLPAPESYSSSSISNCQYSPVCPPGGENRVGANGLPYVWPTATPIGGSMDTPSMDWNTEIEEDPFN